MTNSEAFLTHLASLAHSAPTATSDGEAWDKYIIEWANLSTTPTTGELLSLATAAWQLATILRKQTWERTLINAMALHDAKNTGYAGHSSDPWYNFRLVARFGVTPTQGILARMTDKYSRISSLRLNPANDMIGESLLDNLEDLAAYAVIAVCIMEEKKPA